MTAKPIFLVRMPKPEDDTKIDIESLRNEFNLV